MSRAPTCTSCESLNYKLDQQEKTITQLLEIIAVTNRKVFELERKQTVLIQHPVLQHPTPRFATSEVASISSHMLQSNE